MAKITSEDKKKYQFIEIAGSITLDHIHDFQKEMTQVLSGSHKHIVLDTSQIDHIEASGIGAFVSLQKKMILENREIAFVNMSEQLDQALELVGIKNFFNIYKSESELPW